MKVVRDRSVLCNSQHPNGKPILAEPGTFVVALAVEAEDLLMGRSFATEAEAADCVKALRVGWPDADIGIITPEKWNAAFVDTPQSEMGG